MHRLSHRFIESCDVVFNEGGPHNTQERIVLEPDAADDLMPSPTPTSFPAPPPSASTPSSPPLPSCPKRSTHPPIPDDDPRYNVSSYGHRANVADAKIPEPKTYNEAMSSLDAAEWLTACEDKMRTWKHLDVYDIVPWPKGWKIVGSKWVFCVKWGPDGTIQKYKAQLIAQGFTQVKGIDFDQTFTPVAKLSSLCTIFALATEHDLEVHQMDVKAAYLNADLNEEIYMEVPPSFDIPDSHVLWLKKGVYGTKQGGRVWYINFSGTLSTLSYTPTQADHAIFVCKSPNNFPDVISTYVDDMGLISESLERINQDKEALKQHYQMTDLDEMGWILGICVTHDCEKHTISLCQQKFINDTLERYGMQNTQPISSPTLANEHLLKLLSPSVDAKAYQRALGSLMYPMLATRPDLAYAVAGLGRHAMTPSPDHQHALERVFCYLQVTADYQLVLGCSTTSVPTLLGYADSDWASDVNDRKLTSGYIFTLGGSAIS
jgi:hypothetical protein